VEYHSSKVRKDLEATQPTIGHLHRHKNLIISFPEFIGPKAEPIYLFKVKYPKAIFIIKAQ
jgi:hypothetical protein